jgi:hypothetical protein
MTGVRDSIVQSERERECMCVCACVCELEEGRGKETQRERDSQRRLTSFSRAALAVWRSNPLISFTIASATTTSANVPTCARGENE